jgi:hypothetical protein
MAASVSTPATAISFSASNSVAALTVIPVSNPATEASTPFDTAQASVFDISVVNVSGQVTICVDGGPSVRLWHFTNGAWEDVTTSQTATQTCGLTSSFSPFATAALRVSSVQVQSAAAAQAKRDAEVREARTDISNRLARSESLTLDLFKEADISGVTATNLEQVQAEILALPADSRTDLKQVLKVARKYEVIGKIGSESLRTVPNNAFVEVGLISPTSKNKASLILAVRKAAQKDRDTYSEIQAIIATEAASIKARKDRLASVIDRIKNRFKG